MIIRQAFPQAFPKIGRWPLSKVSVAMFGDLMWDTLLLLGGGASAALNYLRRFEFSSDAVAPLGSPYTEGTGSLTLVQTDGQFSKSGDALVIPTQATPVYGDLGAYDTAALTRTAGLAYFFQINLSTITNDEFMIMFGDGTGASYTKTIENLGIYLAAAVVSLLNSNGGGAVLQMTFVASTDYTFAIIPQAVGGYIFVTGGVFATWNLLAVLTTGSVANLFMTFANMRGVGTSKFMRQYLLGGVFALADGLTVNNVASPVSGTVYTAVADVIAHFKFVLPGVPAAGDTFELRYNVNLSTPTQDYNVVYIKRKADNTNWETFLDTVVGGVSTNRIPAVGSGSPDTIIIDHQGSSHMAYNEASGIRSKRGATISNANQSTSTGIVVVFTVGSAVTLKTYAKQNALVYDPVLNAT